MNKITKGLGLAVLIVGINGAAYVATAPSNAAAVVYEDDPAFNCYTDGNGDCGDTLAYIDDPAQGRGAILAAANDGKVYVSWPDGNVTHAPEWARYAGWETCVANATGGDASLFECDDQFQESGDRFSVRS